MRDCMTYIMRRHKAENTIIELEKPGFSRVAAVIPDEVIEEYEAQPGLEPLIPLEQWIESGMVNTNHPAILAANDSS